MRTCAVAAGDVVAQHPAEMRLVEHDLVFEALTAERPDHKHYELVCPRRVRTIACSCAIDSRRNRLPRKQVVYESEHEEGPPDGGPHLYMGGL